MNFFDIDKTSAKFLIYDSQDDRNATLSLLGDSIDEDQIKDLYPFGESVFYIYEGVALQFIIFVSLEEIKAGQISLDKIFIHPFYGVFVEGLVTKSLIVTKIKTEFIKYLLKNNIAKSFSIEPSHRYKTGIDIAKDKDQQVSQQFNMPPVKNPISEVPILDAIKEAEKKEFDPISDNYNEKAEIEFDPISGGYNEKEEIDKQYPELKDRPIEFTSIQETKEVTVDNNFGQDDSKDNIPFESEVQDASGDHYDIDDLMASSMPEQASPHSEMPFDPDPPKVEEKQEIKVEEKQEIKVKTEEKKADTNMFSNSLDDDMDFSDIMGEQEEDSDPSDF